MPGEWLGLDQSSQAAALSDRVQSSQAFAREGWILLAGGKGGVGKSQIATNLATLFANLNERVLLVDLDMALPKLPILIDFQGPFLLPRFLSGLGGQPESPERTPWGFSLLAAKPGSTREEPFGEGEVTRLIAAVDSIADGFDRVIFDTPAGLTEPLLQLASISGQVILSTMFDPMALSDAYAWIKSMARLKLPTPYLVANRIAKEGDAPRIEQILRTLTDRFDLGEPRWLGEIPEDPGFSSALTKRRPLVEAQPDGPATRALRRIAHRIRKGEPI